MKPDRTNRTRPNRTRPNGKQADRKQAEKAGRRAEHIASWWLRLKGWRIIGQRVRTYYGEVDIIARRGKILAFIEVKLRKEASQLDYVLHPQQLQRMARAAQSLMPAYMRDGEDVRMDAILLAPWHWPRHITNIRLDDLG